jgi:predicted DNA-binding transcriptional regulator YafY
MRASRLLSILTTLQARGRVTAQSLADACEVSLRTIYRDIDALSAAGIPVYAERGAEGGYRLLDGYRTRLNGLSAREAEALFLAGLSGPAADLGLGAAMAAAQLKLLVALPEELRAGAERMRACFHLDAPAWFAEGEQPACLPVIANAVWAQNRLRMRYRSWKAEREWRVDPLGLVLKSGAWYLVARAADRGEGGARTYRIARILELDPCDERFERPDGFDLARYWQESTRRVETEMYRLDAVVRVTAAGLRLLERLATPHARAAMAIGAPECDGRRRVTLPVISVGEAAMDFLRFGVDLEVLEPPELRARLAAMAGQLASLYRVGEERTAS